MRCFDNFSPYDAKCAADKLEERKYITKEEQRRIISDAKIRQAIDDEKERSLRF